MRQIKLLFWIVILTCLGGCMLTKVVTVPMRVGGAVISIVPVVGKPVDKVLDTASDVID
jgi:hypothetical protein